MNWFLGKLSQPKYHPTLKNITMPSKATRFTANVMCKGDNMSNKPNDCENFNVLKCPHRNKDLMREYINKAYNRIPDTLKDVTEGFSLVPKVYETFCKNCESKKLKENQTDFLK